MALSEVTLSKCSEHLSAYKSACENHPDLKSFVISHAVFGAVLAGAFVASIALLTFGVGAVATGAGIALALTMPLSAVGWAASQTILTKQIDTLGKKEEALKELEKKYECVGRGIEINIEAMESVSLHLHRLETKILSILEDVNNAIEDEKDVTDIKIDLIFISEKVEKLTQKIKEVGEAVSRARNWIEKGRDHVMEKITDSV